MSLHFGLVPSWEINMSKHGHGNNNQGGGGGGPQQDDGFRSLKRLFSMLTAFAMWGVSSFFSEQGFAFKYASFWWLGAILAVAIIIIEMVWNEEGMNHGVTIIVAGIFAYSYGILTNIVGLMVAQGITNLSQADPLSMVLSVLLGIMLEIVPEALFTWAITGTRGKDLLSNILGGNRPRQHQHQPQPQQQNQPQPQGQGHQP
jgi:hypothetical protein